jgi:hypothetical protein
LSLPIAEDGHGEAFAQQHRGHARIEKRCDAKSRRRRDRGHAPVPAVLNDLADFVVAAAELRLLVPSQWGH